MELKKVEIRFSSSFSNYMEAENCLRIETSEGAVFLLNARGYYKFSTSPGRTYIQEPRFREELGCPFAVSTYKTVTGDILGHSFPSEKNMRPAVHSPLLWSNSDIPWINSGKQAMTQSQWDWVYSLRPILEEILETEVEEHKSRGDLSREVDQMLQGIPEFGVTSLSSYWD